MEKIQLLADHADHPGQRSPHDVSPWHAPFLIQLIRQTAADPMRFTLHAGNAVAHGKEQRATG